MLEIPYFDDSTITSYADQKGRKSIQSRSYAKVCGYLGLTYDQVDKKAVIGCAKTKKLTLPFYLLEPVKLNVTAEVEYTFMGFQPLRVT